MSDEDETHDSQRELLRGIVAENMQKLQNLTPEQWEKYELRDSLERLVPIFSMLAVLCVVYGAVLLLWTVVNPLAMPETRWRPLPVPLSLLLFAFGLFALRLIWQRRIRKVNEEIKSFTSTTDA